jgi:hypothetical protein
MNAIEQINTCTLTKDMDALKFPVSLNTFYKRDYDYLYISRIIDKVKDMTLVEGYVLTPVQYRAVMIENLLTADSEV